MTVLVPVALLGQTPPLGPPAAILHAQAGVWVNQYEARDSSAIFSGDLIETKPSFSAILTLEGSQIEIQPESVVKFQGDSIELDHGGVAVGTSTSFKVKVSCLTVVPVANALTKDSVTDLTGTVQVAAQQLDVNVLREGGKASPESALGSIVKEGQQQTYDTSQLCGTPAQPANPGSRLNPKWLEIGGGVAGGGILLCVLLCGGGGKKKSMSQSDP